MTKKRKPTPRNAPKGDPWAFPPDIFWLGPEGQVYSIVGHWTDLKLHPDRYGLPAPPETEEEIELAFSRLLEEGWVRGRFSAGTFYFQMDRPRGAPMRLAHELAMRYQAFTKRVEVDFAHPSFAYLSDELSGIDFLEVNFSKRWGLGSPRR